MNVLRRLEGKFAIVTGAAGGIGAAIVRTFAKEGARVALLDLPAKRAEATIIAGEIGEAAHFFPCDVVEAKSCKAAVSEAITRAAVYLASDDAGYVTGAPMMVDGGATAV